MRWLSAVTLLALVAASPAPARAGEKDETQPVLVARVRSLDSVLDNVRLAFRLAGKEEMGKQVEGIIKAKTGPNGLQGIDRKRPFGFYTKIGSDLTDVAAVGMIPIADEKAFLELLENVNFPAKKGDDDLYTVEPNGPLPVPLMLRFANKYAYITAINSDAVSKAKLVSPARVFPSEHQGLASLTIHLDRIPDVAKQIALQQVDDAISREKEKQPPHETARQREFREKSLDTMAARIGDVIRHGQLLNVQVDIDQASNQLKAELSLKADPKSKLAEGLESLGKSTSLFAGLVNPENAVSVLFHASVPKELLSAYVGAIEDGIKQGLDKEKDQTKREHGEKLLKALEPTLKTGEADLVFVARGPAGDHTFAFTGGLKLKDGMEVERALREMVKDLPAEQQALVKWDAETVEGVKVHRLDLQKTYDAKARKVFGDNPVYVAFRSDAVFVVIGHEGLASMKEALAAKSKASGPGRIQVSVARLAQAFVENDEQRQLVRKVFPSGNAGEVLVSVQGGDALRLSATVDLSVFQFGAQFYMVRQAKGAPRGVESP
jgi:hypothetical protein